TPHAINIDELTQKNGTAITKLRNEGSELVAGIGHGERLTRLWHPVAREDRNAFFRLEHFGIKPKAPGKCFVHPDEARCGDGRGWQTRKQALRQARVAVIEGKGVRRFRNEHFRVREEAVEWRCRHHLLRPGPAPGIEVGVVKGTSNGAGFMTQCVGVAGAFSWQVAGACHAVLSPSDSSVQGS